jgi:spore maturation protein A
MLNYVWIGLICIGIFVAIGSDVGNEIQNPYRNGTTIEATFDVQKSNASLTPTYDGELVLPAQYFGDVYGIQAPSTDVHQPAQVMLPAAGGGSVTLAIGDASPSIWKTMAKGLGTKEKMSGKIVSAKVSDDKKTIRVSMMMDKVSFVKVRAVTKAALDYADTAVTLSLGLIGIMALWLGIMKVAEEAGLLKVLTKLLTPVTKRLFPDIPPDHPAVGAMIMNVAANMLGLNNAATPLGLKAMEELNKLNPKAGTATNAMCTFLVINTAGLTIIPATAIALRTAAGSSDPGVIIGTSIFGAGCATVTGLIAVKLLQRLPRYKKQMEVDNG